jgi:hypothetical protein
MSAAGSAGIAPMFPPLPAPSGWQLQHLTQVGRGRFACNRMIPKSCIPAGATLGNGFKFARSIGLQ